MLRTLSLLLSATLLLGCNQQNTRRPADVDSPNTTPTSTKVFKPVDPISADADNTAKNVRDRDPTAKTPIDQNENQRDVNITADIRAKIIEAKLSVNAQNVKVITQDGRVTLRGPVDSAGEKEHIEKIVRSVVRDNFVTELEVTNNQ